MGAIYRIRPADCASAPLRIKVAGDVQGVLVHSGAAGVRIWFDTTTETYPGEHSIPAVTGLCAARRIVREVIFRAEDGTVPADVVVELLDCKPAYVANVGRGLIHHLYQATNLAIAETSPTASVTALVNSNAIDLGDETNQRVLPIDNWYLGGAVTCDQPVTLRLWNRLRPSVRALCAVLEVLAADPDGKYSASLETGWKRTHNTFGSNTQTHLTGPLLPLAMPWELHVVQASGTACSLSAQVYVRTFP